jgi:hypothetical protein
MDLIYSNYRFLNKKEKNAFKLAKTKTRWTKMVKHFFWVWVRTTYEFYWTHKELEILDYK